LSGLPQACQQQAVGRQQLRIGGMQFEQLVGIGERIVDFFQPRVSEHSKPQCGIEMRVNRERLGKQRYRLGITLPIDQLLGLIGELLRRWGRGAARLRRSHRTGGRARYRCDRRRVCRGIVAARDSRLQGERRLSQLLGVFFARNDRQHLVEVGDGTRIVALGAVKLATYEVRAEIICWRLNGSAREIVDRVIKLAFAAIDQAAHVEGVRRVDVECNRFTKRRHRLIEIAHFQIGVAAPGVGHRQIGAQRDRRIEILQRLGPVSLPDPQIGARYQRARVLGIDLDGLSKSARAWSKLFFRWST
jgi:hypothetical protein